MNSAEIILCNAYNLKYVVGNAPTGIIEEEIFDQNLSLQDLKKKLDERVKEENQLYNKMGDPDRAESRYAILKKVDNKYELICSDGDSWWNYRLFDPSFSEEAKKHEIKCNNYFGKK